LLSHIRQDVGQVAGAAEDRQLGRDGPHVGGRVGQRVVADEPLAGPPAVGAALSGAVVGVTPRGLAGGFTRSA
jgi:hypothetical protein